MAYEKISYELRDGIAVITLDDPATLNACGTDMVQELLQAVEAAASDARCTILTGTGRGFCSGANLGSIDTEAKSGDKKPKSDFGRQLEMHYNPLVLAIRKHPHPVITAVNGVAAGVGCSIALMGDIIICAKSAYFLQAFRRIGLVPDGGSTWLLPRAVGRARAMEIALLGEKVPAEKALEWGLVNRMVEDEDLMPTAMEFAEKLVTGPTVALGLTRGLIWDAAEDTFAEALQAERYAQRTAGQTEDSAEGIRAFQEKRKAVFKGK